VKKNKKVSFHISLKKPYKLLTYSSKTSFWWLFSNFTE